MFSCKYVCMYITSMPILFGGISNTPEQQFESEFLIPDTEIFVG